MALGTKTELTSMGSAFVMVGLAQSGYTGEQMVDTAIQIGEIWAVRMLEMEKNEDSIESESSS